MTIYTDADAVADGYADVHEAQWDAQLNGWGTDLDFKPLALPFFVYGSLRPAHGNSNLWKMRATAEHDGTATAMGLRLVGNRNPFPYAFVSGNPTDITVGTIVRPNPGKYEAVRTDLDHLEGHPSHYGRRAVEINHPEAHGRTSTRCWVYLAPDSARIMAMEEVPGGDWTASRSATDLPWWMS